MTAVLLPPVVGKSARFCLLCLLACLNCVSSRAVLVAWDPNPPSEGVDGYRIYLVRGGIGGTTNSPIDVGRVTLAPLPNLEAGVSYQIFLTAYNSAGESDPSDSVLYTPPVGSILPAIKTQPTNQVVAQAGTLTLVAEASGTPPLRFDWTRNGVSLPNLNTNKVVIDNVQTSHEGGYQVRVSNPLGTVTSQIAMVTVNTKPAISLHPQNRSLIQGNEVTFSVTATGSAPLAYQWRKDGSDIPGATGSSYTIPSAQLAHEGSYRVFVANNAGNVLSDPAILDVVPSVEAVPPSFAAPLTDTNVFEGELLILDLLVSGTEPLAIQWFKDGVPIDWETNATLVLLPATIPDTGIYHAIASNAAGRATSAVAMVAVTVSPDLLPPEIITQPSSLSVNSGSTVALTVEAVSNGLVRYQWSFNGIEIPDETNSVLLLSNVTLANEGAYSAIAFNSAGSELSDEAFLRVHTVPVFSSQPVDVTVPEGGSATLLAGGGGLGLIQYRWFKNGGLIPGATSATFTIQNAQPSDEASYVVEITDLNGASISAPARVRVIRKPAIVSSPSNLSVPDGAPAEFWVQFTGADVSFQWLKNGSPIPGQNHPYLLIPSAEYSDSGAYSVRISNIAGEATSTEGILEIAGPPVIATQPSGGVAHEGSTFNLSVAAIGAGPLQYRWFIDGTVIPGATASILALSPVRSSHQGSYQVEVRNNHGLVLSPLASVQVLLRPTIGQQPKALRVAVGAEARFSVGASGPGPLSFQWRRNGSAIAGATSSDLRISSAQVTDGGSYNVLVSNQAGSVASASASLFVIEPASIGIPPQPQSLIQGETLRLEVGASGSGPFQYQWLKNGAEILGATRSVLEIANASTNDAGSYRVRVSNELRGVTSSEATVTVAAAPTISGTPASLTLPAGRSTYTLTAGTIGGTKPFSFQWFKDGAPIQGATAAELVLPPIVASLAGSYQLQVSNSVAVVRSSPTVLTVRSAPILTTHPASASLEEGSAMRLSVQAGGDGPFSYQWFRNGLPIASATSSIYQVESIAAEHAGVYSVRVENDVTSVSSNPANIEVLLPPRIVSQSGHQTIAENGSLVLAVNVSGTAPFSYRWYRDGALLPVTTRRLAFYGLKQADAGVYVVQVENAHGIAESQPMRLSVALAPQGSERPPTVGVRASGDRPVLTLKGAPGRTYAIEACRDLSRAEWVSLGQATVDEKGVVEFTAASEFQGPAAFFRLKK